MEEEDRVAGAGEGIVLETADGEVAGGVEERLGLGAVDLPAVGALFEAVDVIAAQQVLHVRRASLLAPEEVDVAGQAAGVVFEGVLDRASVAISHQAGCGQVADEVGGAGRQDIRVEAEVNLKVAGVRVANNTQGRGWVVS